MVDDPDRPGSGHGRLAAVDPADALRCRLHGLALHLGRPRHPGSR